MGRLIDVREEPVLPPNLAIGVGDLVLFGATGGRVLSGADVVEAIGPFLPGILTDNGDIISPMGAPNTIGFLARRPGRAEIDVVTGDPWGASRSVTLEVIVEGAPGGW